MTGAVVFFVHHWVAITFALAALLAFSMSLLSGGAFTSLIYARILAFLIGHWLEIALGLILAGLCIGFAKHERNVQAAKDAQTINGLTNQLKLDSGVFKAIKAAEDRNKAAAAAQAKAGQAALAGSARAQKAHEREWRDKLAKAHKAIAQVTCADQALPDGIDL